MWSNFVPQRGFACADVRSAIVDIHCHVLMPVVVALMEDVGDPSCGPSLTFVNEATHAVNCKQEETIRGELTSIENRLRDLDRARMDIQTISPLPKYLCRNISFLPDSHGVASAKGCKAARSVNNRIAEIVASDSGRFVGIGTVSLQGPEIPTVEHEQMVNELGRRGEEIDIKVPGVELSDERFRLFFAKAQALDVPSSCPRRASPRAGASQIIMSSTSSAIRPIWPRGEPSHSRRRARRLC